MTIAVGLNHLAETVFVGVLCFPDGRLWKRTIVPRPHLS